MKEKFFLVSLGRGFELRWSRRSNSLGVKPPGPVVLAGGTSAHVASHCMGDGRSQVSGPTTPGPAICLHLPPHRILNLKEKLTNTHQPCSRLLPCMLITSCHHRSFGKGGGTSTHDMARPRKSFRKRTRARAEYAQKTVPAGFHASPVQRAALGMAWSLMAAVSGKGALVFFYPRTLLPMAPLHTGSLEWLWVGICLSCKSGADMSVEWRPKAVIVVDQNEDVNFV